jgi:hypothetical protein
LINKSSIRAVHTTLSGPRISIEEHYSSTKTKHTDIMLCSIHQNRTVYKNKIAKKLPEAIYIQQFNGRLVPNQGWKSGIFDI